MAQDPIDELKNQLATTQRLCEDLRIFIQQSNQTLASSKIQEIEDSISKVTSKLKNEFGWLMSQEEE